MTTDLKTEKGRVGCHFHTRLRREVKASIREMAEKAEAVPAKERTTQEDCSRFGIRVLSPYPSDDEGAI
jgi:hypothetical protein